MNKVKVISDFVTNLISSLLITIILQLMVYPFLGRVFIPIKYGNILTIMGILNIVVAMFGNALNNTRLIMNNEMKSKYNNFNFILIITCITSVIFIFIYLYIFEKYDLLNVFFLVLSCLFGIFRTYFSCEYRLRNKYTSFFCLNIVITLGYILSIFLFFHAEWWGVIFFCGELLGAVFILFTSAFVREPIMRTNKLKKTLNIYKNLVFATGVSNIVLYLDRLLLLPLLGGVAVSTFTVASFWGKIMSIAVAPIAGVLLGYLSNNTFQISKRNYKFMNICFLCFACIFLVISYYLAPFFTKVLYPTIYTKARPYIFILTFSNLINAYGILLQPVLMKYGPSKLQVIIQIIYGIMYIVGGIIISKIAGLFGFCILFIIANSIRTIMYHIFAKRYIKE